MVPSQQNQQWHAPDCCGAPQCSGCGYIGADLLWHPGPCPRADRRHQRVRSELGEIYDHPLELVPIGLKAANAWVVENHRHHGKVAGHKFSVGLACRGELVGVAIAGRPSSRMLDDGSKLEVVRVAVLENEFNGCTMLYAAVARAAVAMGYSRQNVLTYILESESGASLLAAGWVRVSDSAGGSWDRAGRPRTDKHPTEAKVRWHASPISNPRQHRSTHQ